MQREQFLESLALVGNILRSVAREERQNAHRFKDAQHFIVGAECPGMGKDAIVCSLQFVRDKSSKRVEHRRLSHWDYFEIGWIVSCTHGRSTCLARSNSEKSRRR